MIDGPSSSTTDEQLGMSLLSETGTAAKNEDSSFSLFINKNELLATGNAILTNLTMDCEALEHAGRNSLSGLFETCVDGWDSGSECTYPFERYNPSIARTGSMPSEAEQQPADEQPGVHQPLSIGEERRQVRGIPVLKLLSLTFYSDASSRIVSLRRSIEKSRTELSWKQNSRLRNWRQSYVSQSHKANTSDFYMRTFRPKFWAYRVRFPSRLRRRRSKLAAMAREICDRGSKPKAS